MTQLLMKKRLIIRTTFFFFYLIDYCVIYFKYAIARAYVYDRNQFTTEACLILKQVRYRDMLIHELEIFAKIQCEGCKSILPKSF